ncbi:MAG: hypothetical protein Q4D98_00370 [Planctomycetia bacterium]|nr:hypothetical protein [Planctomycetia bacterium]
MLRYDEFEELLAETLEKRGVSLNPKNVSNAGRVWRGIKGIFGYTDDVTRGAERIVDNGGPGGKGKVEVKSEEVKEPGFHEAKPKSILNPSPEELARRQHFADAAAETEAEAAKLRKQWEAEDLTKNTGGGTGGQVQRSDGVSGGGGATQTTGGKPVTLDDLKQKADAGSGAAPFRPAPNFNGSYLPEYPGGKIPNSSFREVPDIRRLQRQQTALILSEPEQYRNLPEAQRLGMIVEWRNKGLPLPAKVEQILNPDSRPLSGLSPDFKPEAPKPANNTNNPPPPKPTSSPSSKAWDDGIDWELYKKDPAVFKEVLNSNFKNMSGVQLREALETASRKGFAVRDDVLRAAQDKGIDVSHYGFEPPSTVFSRVAEQVAKHPALTTLGVGAGSLLAFSPTARYVASNTLPAVKKGIDTMANSTNFMDQILKIAPYALALSAFGFPLLALVRGASSGYDQNKDTMDDATRSLQAWQAAKQNRELTYDDLQMGLADTDAVTDAEFEELLREFRKRKRARRSANA